MQKQAFPGKNSLEKSSEAIDLRSPILRKILSVTELTFAIKKQLERSYPFICVKGEISNFKAQSSGHLYFTLKDERAQISAVFFKGDARALTRLPKAGDAVIVQGELSVYPPRGNYQIIVRSLQFEGVGELLLKFHALKQKLENKGWFEAKNKKQLPPYPKKIGVITSPTGSVIQDILHVLNRRFSGFHLILNPVKVQGEGAAQEIADALDQMNHFAIADLLIVGRGGGSLEDLWPFNEECVAEAIFRSRIPIISAVGHETDVTLADYVADVRAPTPSAAAEIATSEKVQQLKNLQLAKKRMVHALSSRMQHDKIRLRRFVTHPYLTSPSPLLNPYRQLVDETTSQLDIYIKTQFIERKLKLEAFKRQAKGLNPLQQLLGWRTQFQTARLQLLRQIKEMTAQKKERLFQLARHLRAIDPKNLLSKGYALLFAEKGNSVIFSARQLSEGTKVSLMLHDGEAKATIDEVTK